MEEYAGKVRLVIKHFPYKYRDYAFLAAQAAEAAKAQGKFWEMHDLMLERKKLDRDSLLGYARELDLDLARFEKELDNKTHLARVQADLDLAHKLDFFQTPTFVINGRVLVGERPITLFREMIDQALLEADGK